MNLIVYFLYKCGTAEWRVIVLVYSTFVVGAVLHVSGQAKVSQLHTVYGGHQHIPGCNVSAGQNTGLLPSQKETTFNPHRPLSSPRRLILNLTPGSAALLA